MESDFSSVSGNGVLNAPSCCRRLYPPRSVRAARLSKARASVSVPESRCTPPGWPSMSRSGLTWTQCSTRSWQGRRYSVSSGQKNSTSTATPRSRIQAWARST